MKTVPLLWSVSLAALVGGSCTKHIGGNTASDTPSSDPPADSQSVGGTVAGGGNRDARPRVTIMSPVRGASNVDAKVRIGVSIFCPYNASCASDVTGTLAIIASKMKIVDSGGKEIGVIPEPTTTVASAKGDTIAPVPTNEYLGGLVPAEALAPDTAYKLTAASDSDIVLGFIDDSEAEQKAALAASKIAPAPLRIAVFTGSSPTITRLELSNSAGKPLTHLRVRFSEPVELATLVDGLSVKAADGTPLSICPISAVTQQCVDSKAQEAAELIDVSLIPKISLAAVQTAIVRLSGSVKGAGRSVLEGAQIRGNTNLQTGSSLTSSLVATLNSAAWMSCSSEGDVLCIRDMGL